MAPTRRARRGDSGLRAAHQIPKAGAVAASSVAAAFKQALALALPSCHHLSDLHQLDASLSHQSPIPFFLDLTTISPDTPSVARCLPFNAHISNSKLECLRRSATFVE
jgi:hypothetical protein